MSRDRGKLLVVGAGGLLGPWISNAALEAGWSVIGLSRTPVPSQNHGAGFTSVLADASEIAACRKWIAASDAIAFNAAYIPAHYASAAEASACLDFNALVPLAFLSELVANPLPFIYISSGQGYRPTRGAGAENDLLFPAGHAAYYLASKLLGDIITEHHRLEYGIPASVLRAGSLYGPGQRRGMVARFIQQARAGSRIILADEGSGSADLTFVGDVAAAVVASLELKGSGIYNIGSGRATSALEAARIILSACGRDESLLDLQPPGEKKPVAFAPLDITRARAELGLTPTPPELGLVRTVKEWRDFTAS